MAMHQMGLVRTLRAALILFAAILVVAEMIVFFRGTPSEAAGRAPSMPQATSFAADGPDGRATLPTGVGAVGFDVRKGDFVVIQA
ncbi:MAG: hypothetical protein AAFR44_06540, partial [Pseudomonadota bacterium]